MEHEISFLREAVHVVCNVMILIAKIMMLYFSCLLAVAGINLIFGSNLTSYPRSSAFWIAPAVFIGIGLLTAVIIELVSKKVNNNVFYKVSLIFCLFFVMGILAIRYSWWNTDRKFGNIVSNEVFLENVVQENNKEKRIAFDTLLRNFGNKNDVRIFAIYDDYFDELTNYDSGAIAIKILYNKRGIQELLKANLVISQDTAYLLQFDRQLTAADKAQKENFESEAIELLKEGLNGMSDSMKQQLKKSLKDITD